MKMRVLIKEKSLEKAILRRNLTYKDIAKKLKISRVYLSNIKNEAIPDFRPSPALRERIMTRLDVTFDDIFKIQSGEASKSETNKKTGKKVRSPRTKARA